MGKKTKSRRDQLIEAYELTKEEIAYLDLCHTDTWFTHKEPQMYIMSARRALTKYHCSECGCEISEDEHEDYGMCSRCRESFGD